MILLQAKLLNCPKSYSEMQAIVEQWQALNVTDIYLLSQQIQLLHIQRSLQEYDGKIWIVLQTLLDTIDGDFPLAILDSGIAAIGSGKGDWLKILCPRGVNKEGETILSFRVQQLLQLIKKYSPYGISLDFIRHFGFWEEVYPSSAPEDIPRSCFCDSCCLAFIQEYQLDLPTLNVTSRAKWILKHHLDDWNTFAEDTISNFVKNIVTKIHSSYPQIKFSLHAVPWMKDEFSSARSSHIGQNLKELSHYVDQVSPMAYSPMLKRDDSWIPKLTINMQDESRLPILPALQVCPMYGTAVLSKTEFHEMVLRAAERPAKGVIIWPWETLTREQFQVLQSFV